MANRIFKQYGLGRDSAGSMNVILTINDAEVYNDTITVNTSNTSGVDMSETELFSFELDESITSNVDYQITMSGTDSSSILWISGLQCNLIKNNMTIDHSWFAERLNALDQANLLNEMFPMADQQYIADTIGQTRLDAQKPGTYDALRTGTAPVGKYGWYIHKANEDMGGKQTDAYTECDWALSNGKLNDEAYDVSGIGMWPKITSNSTLSMTVRLGIQNYVYNPNPEFSDGGSLEGQL